MKPASACASASDLGAAGCGPAAAGGGAISAGDRVSSGSWRSETLLPSATA